MTMMPLELIEQLPSEIDPEAVVDHVYVGHAPGGGYGETHLLSHGGRLHVFGRSSMLDKLEQLTLTAGALPRLKRGSFNSTLHVPTPGGEERIVLSMFEVDPAAALVGALHPEAVGPDPDAPDAPDAPEAPPAPPPAPPPSPPKQSKRKKARQAEPPPTPPAMPPAKPLPAPPERTGFGDPQAEVARYEKLLAEHPDDVVASLSLEEIYRGEGDSDNLARILLARVEHLDSVVEQVETMQEAADLYAAMGDADNALEILQTAYLYDYMNRDTVDQLERLVDEHNLWNKLLTGLNKEVQNHEQISARAGILVQMSRWYRKIYSRSDYADACLMHAKRLDPQHPEVLAALNEPV
jgi:tetratricopeptide (TPR) repeat protein